MLIVPGDTPTDRVAILEKAVAAVLTDPKVLAEGERTNRPITYGPASESRTFVDSILGGFDAKDQAFLKELLLSGY